MEFKINIPDEEVVVIKKACEEFQLNSDKVIQALVTSIMKSVLLILDSLRKCL